MISKIFQFIIIKEIPENFEKNYLTLMNRVALWFFALHVPAFILVAYFNETGPLLAGMLTLATLSGPAVAMKSFKSQRTIAIVMGIASMFMGALLVHFGQGPVQIEMHFYFFVLLALLAVFADPLVILAAAVTAALHHAIFWVFLPASVFNYDAPFWVVGVHALFVVMESVAACFIARTFFDNINGLEKKVEERTCALESRNQDMRTMLDAVQQGFFTIDRELKISEERSGAVDRCFGSPSGMTLPQFLSQFDPSVADWMEFGLEDVFADILPVEVTIDQLPKRFVANNSTYSIEFTPVLQDGVLTDLAVVISDVSAAVEKEQLETMQREMLAMVHRLADDKDGLIEFMDEGQSLVDSIVEQKSQDLALIKRQIHTLKGNSAIYGLERVAKTCHEVEDEIEQSNSIPESVELERLRTVWESVNLNFQRLVGADSRYIEISQQEYNRLLQDILSSSSRDELAVRVSGWSLEPTEKRLARLGEQAIAFAQRIGKGDIAVTRDSNGLLMDSEHWSDFWSSFVHIIRNAVDHGLESNEERESNGNNATGEIELSTRIDDQELIISVKDNGKGIDWGKVREKCQQQGITCESEQDLVEALFTDGLSTRDTVTESSGRGVGLAAVKASTKKLNGSIRVESESGLGTEFQFIFPAEQLAPSTLQSLTENNIYFSDLKSVVSRNDTLELAGASASSNDLGATTA